MAGRPNRDGSSGPERSKLLVGDRSEPGELVQTAPALKSTTDNERTMSMADSSSADYKGPGYDLTRDANGDYVLKLSSDPMRQIAQHEYDQKKEAERAAIPDDFTSVPEGPATPEREEGTNPFDTTAPIIMDTFKASAPTNSSLNAGQPSTRSRAPSIGNVDIGSAQKKLLAGVTNDPNAGTPGSQAPDFDRTNIDRILENSNKYQNVLDGLIFQDSQSDLSVAEAQLLQSQKTAAQRASIDLEANRRSALGAAAGARNRGDRGLLERQAVGESAFLGQEAARTAALQQTQTEGDLATLRANEEQQDKEFLLKAVTYAQENNLNVAGLEMGIGQMDLDSANKWIAEEFGQYGLDKQLDQQEAESLRGFFSEMATIQFQYAKLSSEEKRAMNEIIMDKYKVDEETKVALKRIEEENGFDLGELAMNAVSGFASGAGGAAGKAAFSDRRLKNNIEPGDIEELLGTLESHNFVYNDPNHGHGKQFGLMAQDLLKSELGSSMVLEDDGRLKVDLDRAGYIALAALPILFKQIKDLQDEMKTLKSR